MKPNKIWIIVIVAASIVALLGIQNWHLLFGYHWEKFFSPDAKFSVELPGKTESFDSQTPLSDGTSSRVIWVKSSPDSWLQYSCGYTEDRDRKDPDEVQAETWLDSYRDGVLTKASVRGVAVREKTLSIQGHPARNVQANLINDPGSSLDMLIVLAGTRTYYLRVFTTQHNRDEKTIQRFFDSFAIH
jgi:hypothetical protein